MSSVAKEQSFFVDKKVAEKLISAEGKGEEPIDTMMFEKEASNRSSVVSGFSNSSNESGSTLYDSNENEVDGGCDLTPEEKKARKVFNIAKEIMTSEQEFVNVLHLINVAFREFVLAEIRKENVMPEREFCDLFGNLLEIQILNADLLKDFQSRIENWKSQKKIADVFVRKGGLPQVVHFLRGAVLRQLYQLHQMSGKVPNIRETRVRVRIQRDLSQSEGDPAHVEAGAEAAAVQVVIRNLSQEH